LISAHSMKALRNLACGAALLASLSLGAPRLLAQNITGTVTNKTTGHPAAGDTVTLIKLANGMQEADHTTSDARGHFTLPVDDQGMHLVRVTHDKVPYFQPVPPGTSTADVTVYDSAEKVTGVGSEADVMRMQTADNSIEVTELFALKNTSSPPRTQFGARAFELYLPAAADITSGAALGPGGMPIQARPVPLGDPGHYAFVFPIRPGQTRFQIAYRLPYSGKLAFQPRLSLPAENVAVMLPKTMTFAAASGAAYAPVQDDVNAQVFLVKNATPSQALGFTVSGTGQMPKEADDTAPHPGAQGAAGGAEAGPEAGPEAATGSAMPAQRPGGGLGNPIDTPDPLHKYRWWVLAAIVLLFVVGIAFAMRKPTARPLDAALTPYAPPPVVAGATLRSAAPTDDGLMQALKNEMFTLETDRLEGRITDDQYLTVKSALEIVLRHALKRNAGVAAASK
jgi:hypothetical protein